MTKTTKTHEITLTVETTTGYGTRTATFRGRNAEREAAYWTKVWVDAGHKVTRV